jgi:hypothetical protein
VVGIDALRHVHHGRESAMAALQGGVPQTGRGRGRLYLAIASGSFRGSFLMPFGSARLITRGVSVALATG